MIAGLRNLRLVPIVLVASACLFALKMIGIIANGGYTLGAGYMAMADRAAQETQNVHAEAVRPEAPGQARIVVGQPRIDTRGLMEAPKTADTAAGKPAARLSWAQDLLKFPDGGAPDITGSVPAAKPPASDPGAGKADTGKPEAAKKPVDPPPAPAGKTIVVEAKPVSPAERAILERLQERRRELDERASELDVRQSLIEAAEKRLQEKLKEIEATEARINEALKKKEEMETARLKSLVTMYENMKAKDAAKIFDRLDIKLATEVANQINPRRMSDILAQMSPDAAERLTVELANRSGSAEKATPQELPKIEGRPSGT
jgi:flagellar motility protein MotE (MotC chaperone)